MSQHVIGIRFQKLGKTYHFDASAYDDTITGDFAVVHTRRGLQIGQVVQVLDDEAKKAQKSWKRIERKATAQDLVMRQTWNQKETEATIDSRAYASELNIKGVKFVTSDFSFDGNNLTIIYSSEGDERPDFKSAPKKTRAEVRPHSH